MIVVAVDETVIACELFDHAVRRKKQHSDERDEKPRIAVVLISRNVIIRTVQQHRYHNGEAAAAQAAIRIADIVVALGKAVKCTHESAEAGMSRHGRDSAYQCCAETIHQHIADVLPQGKAKRNKHGIDHAVKLAVEFARPPGALSQQQVFEPLL